MTIIAKDPSRGNNLQTIDFNGQQLLTIEKDGVHYAAVKPIAENIGLAWHGQFQRIKRDEVLNSVVRVIGTTGTDGKQYDMMCLPIEYLNGWLFGVDAKRVKPEVKAPLIQYKMQCYKVLHDYWHTGQAIHPSANEELPSSVKDRNGLIKTVHMTMKRLDLGFSEAFNLVLHRFNVPHVGDLTVSQVGDAVEYLHRLMFTGNADAYRPSNTEQPNNYGFDGDLYTQLMKSGTFIAEIDSNGRLIMRELFADEFISTMKELPSIIRSRGNYSLDELSQINVATSQLIAMAAYSLSNKTIAHDNQA